jgi:ligand-binding sensor domain-containing protein/DNA-binding CsgD family transcriptional regulator
MRPLFRLLGHLMICTRIFSGPSYPGRFYRFERLIPRSGAASDSAFTSICQDSEGFLWFGTSAGLARYDGYRLVYISPKKGNASNEAVGVFPVTTGRSGDIWVGTSGAGLFRLILKTEKLIPYSSPLDSAGLGNSIVLAIQEDREGFLWVGTRTHGLVKCVLNAGTSTRVPLRPKAETIWDLLVDSRGDIWVGTLDEGLFRIEGAGGNTVNFRFAPDDPSSLGSNTVWTVFEDSQGTIWAGTRGGGLNRWDPATGRFKRFYGTGDFPRDLAGQTITAIAEDRAGNLWLGTSTDGLRMWNRVTDEYVAYKHDPQDPESLSDDKVTSIYLDTSGVLWVGTVRGGLNKCVTGTAKFPHYKHNRSNPRTLGHSDVRSLWFEDAAALWTGTGAGLERLEVSSGRVTHRFKALPGSQGQDDQILVVRGDSRGNIWLGTLSGGLVAFNRKSGVFTRYRHDPLNSNSLPNDKVTSLWPDAGRADVLWVGTHLGLSRLEVLTRRWTRLFNDPRDVASLSNNTVTAISEDRRGHLWVGTRWGLNRLDKLTGRCERFVHRLEDVPGTSISGNTVHCVLEDRDGIIWAGTESGLNRLDTATGIWRYFGERDGLSGDVVCGLLEDASGSIWVSTDRGLSRLEPQTGKIIRFGTRDGLQGPSFNPGACFKGPDGRLFFGGANGANVIDPAGIRKDPFVPPVVWTALYHGNVEVEVAESLSTLRGLMLPHNSPLPALEFAALSFAAPELNTFACRLEPRDNAWVPLGTNNRVSLSGVGAGRYMLRVKAANPDGVWNETGIGIAIKVLPPFWETWWFLLIAGAFLVSGVVSAVALWRKIRSISLATGESLESVVGLYALTSREREILRLVLQGADNKDIARKLFISGSTVRNHIYNIYQKLGVRNRIELVKRVAGDARKRA